MADTATLPGAQDGANPPLLAQLRAATAAAHTRLDSAFGSLDLMQRSHLLRFLRAHRRGLEVLDAAASAMIGRELGLEAPDYLAMLDRDIAALAPDEAPPASAPGTSLPGSGGMPGSGDMAAAGAAYVVTGSRLGLATLRKRGYWGADAGYRSAYMEDASGIAVWRALAPHLSRPVTAAESREACAAALYAFESYARAFAESRGGTEIESRNALHG